MNLSPTDFAGTMADVLNTRDFDRFDDMFAIDFVNHNELAPSGRDGFKQFWAGMLSGLPDLRVTLEDALSADDETSARYTLRGTHRGTLLGLAPTGRAIEMKTMEFWRFEDGLVVEHWDSVNTLEVLQQLDVLPSHEALFAARA
jgi:steroid delta-isomerase-like uncharacterized protein